jgi:predicted helicase
LKHVKGFADVWLLKDLPNDILEKLSMKRQDMGIDIVARTPEQKYIAIQCKYKKHTSFKQNILSWKSLSTFYALCLRTGPWEKYIIMTNCIYTRHQGKKTPKDISYCLKTLQNITKDEWLKMCCKTGQTISTIIDVKEEVEVEEEIIELLIKTKPTITKTKLIKKKSDPVLPNKEELRKLRNNFFK